MSNIPLPCPKRRRWRWIVALIALAPITLIVGLWLTLPPAEPGTRTRLVRPGRGGAAAFAGATQLEIAPPLQADGIRIKLGAMMRSSDTVIFVCREECKQEVLVTAGPQPLRTGELRYTLFDGKGNEIGAGTLFPNPTLQANAEGRLIIGDFALEQTAKIVIGK
jgi:hypothetical protein